MLRLILSLLLAAAFSPAQPVRVHSANPHYFEFRGKPILLVTSAEHYGAVVNGDFDYVAYLDKLKAYGLNYTRIYPGFLFEPMGKFIKGNSLGVRPTSLVLPWARSGKPGYALGGNLFDLDQWNPAFFRRLKDFIAKAGERGIVVEICFYNAQYGDTWPMSPLYYENNVQGEGKCDFEDAQTLKHADLVRREDEYVRKITQEVNEFDNVILEICDEPYLTGTPIDLAGAWIAHSIEVVRDAEKPLPKKHLLAQQIEGPIGGPCDFTRHPGIDVIVTQYAWESGFEQMGGMKGLDYLYDRNKPIELNETNYYPVWYRGDKIASSRAEAWEFIVGGGAGFNHLNGLFTVRDPAGNTDENHKVLNGLKNLLAFMDSFDYVNMRPGRDFVRGGVPLNTFVRGLSQPGKQYALYHHHGKLAPDTSSYIVEPGDYQENFTLDLPAGDYRLDWIDPATGQTLASESIQHAGGHFSAPTPHHTVDLALRVRRQ